MANKPKYYRVDDEKSIVYANIKEIDEVEMAIVNKYRAFGFKLKEKDIKPSKTVAEMRAELKDYPAVLAAFNAAYAEKAPKEKKGEKNKFKVSGFSKAVKIYNEWKKNPAEAEAKEKD